MLGYVLYILRVKKVFERERVPLELRALGIILICLGLSYGKAAQVCTSVMEEPI